MLHVEDKLSNSKNQIIMSHEKQNSNLHLFPKEPLNAGGNSLVADDLPNMYGATPIPKQQPWESTASVLLLTFNP